MLTVDYPVSPSVSAPSTNGSATSASVQLPNAGTLFPAGRLNAFLDGEDRYADIRLVAPNDAARLRAALSQRTRLVYLILSGLTRLL